MTTAMLKWAKTKSAFKGQKNVKDAKKFTDLTPAKQKIIKSQYEKKFPKKKPPPIPPNVKGKKIKPPVKKARKPPTRLYTLEGYGLMDDDPEEGEDPMLAFGLEEYGFTLSNMYPSGLQAFTARLTKEQLKEFDKYHGEQFEPYTRLFTETKKQRTFFYDMGE